MRGVYNHRDTAKLAIKDDLMRSIPLIRENEFGTKILNSTNTTGVSNLQTLTRSCGDVLAWQGDGLLIHCVLARGGSNPPLRAITRIAEKICKD